MTKRLLRLLRIVPLVLLYAGVASAQTTGTIIGVVTDASTGKPVAGALVVATSPTMQGEQTAITDASGNYRIQILPPGDYKLAVQLEGFKPAERSDIKLSPDKTIRANLAVVPEAVQLEEQVVRTGVAPVVNIGSAETGAVVSREFIQNVPVGRGFDQIAAVAPTAKTSVVGIGFAGAQGAENQYIVDGFNTTDPAYGTRGGNGGFDNNAPPSLRSDFLQELDVKTSGFNAEYGRAVGGIVNAVLKSGSNEFHGSVFSTLTPNSWVTPDGKVAGGMGEALAYRTHPSAGTYGLDFGFEVGGPILKDKLWFFAGFAPVLSKTMYQRFQRENVTPTNSGGACPAGSTPDGAYGECIDSLGNSLQHTIPGSERNLDTSRTTYQWVGKLTYLLNENNSFTAEAFGTPSSRQSLNGGGPFYGASPAAAAPSRVILPTDDNQTSVVGRYSGKFLDKKLIAEAQIGLLKNSVTPQDKTVGGYDQFGTPEIEWGGAPFTLRDFQNYENVPAGYCDPADPAACPLNAYTTGGRGLVGKNSTDRYNGKASVSYLLDLAGQHNLKGGLDLERLNYDVNGYYSGGTIFVYVGPSSTATPYFYAYRGYGNLLNPGGGALPVGSTGFPGLEWPVITAATSPVVFRTTQSNNSRTDSFAYFLQDSWQPSFYPNLTLNAGIRLETQSMTNTSIPDAQSFDITNNWAPRVQAIWDFTGNGRGKVAASWGRYFAAMPLDMGNRALGAEIQLQYRVGAESCGYTFGTTNPGTFDPLNVDLGPLGPYASGFRSTSCVVQPRGGANNDVRLYGGPSIVDPKLQGAYNDQFGAQVEYEVLQDLGVGIDYQGRRLGAIIEDMSSNDGGTFFISNPAARSGDIVVNGQVVGNATNVTTYDPMTGKSVNTTFPKPERSYDGLTFKVTKTFSKNWMAQGSYTYSSLRGNYSGPYYPEYGQLDPGITAAYDLASLMGNTKGYLPGDTTHQIKLFGAYTYNFTTRLGATLSGAYNGISGTPVSAMGAQAEYGASSAFIIPRGQAGRTPFVNTVDLGAGVSYTIRKPYTVAFRVDVFNVFNSQTVLEYDQDYTFDTVTPISNMNCSSRNSAGKSDPITAIQADCPGLAELKSVDGRPVTVNPNFGRASRLSTAYQLPISLRLGLAVSF
jgi:hypothetical protein